MTDHDDPDSLADFLADDDVVDRRDDTPSVGNVGQRFVWFSTALLYAILGYALSVAVDVLAPASWPVHAPAHWYQQAVKLVGLGIALLLVAALVLLLGLGGLARLASWVASKRRHRGQILGTSTRVEVDPAVGITCCCCHARDVDGELRRYRKERVVLGFPVRTVEAGENAYCQPCADDPLEAAIRAEQASDAAVAAEEDLADLDLDAAEKEVLDG